MPFCLETYSALLLRFLLAATCWACALDLIWLLTQSVFFLGGSIDPGQFTGVGIGKEHLEHGYLHLVWLTQLTGLRLKGAGTLPVIHFGEGRPQSVCRRLRYRPGCRTW